MQATDPAIKVLVVYYSRFGVMKRLAERIAEGARRVEGVEMELLAIEDRPVDELRPGESPEDMAERRGAIIDRLTDADALIIGAPAYFGGMASPMKRFFEDCATASGPPTNDRSRPWRHALFQGAVGAAFTASGTPHGGNEQTLHSILTLMMHLGMVIVTPGQRPPILEHSAAPYGATAISGPNGDRPPTQNEEDAARELGEQVARVTTWLRWGRQAWERARSGWQPSWHGRVMGYDPSA